MKHLLKVGFVFIISLFLSLYVSGSEQKKETKTEPESDYRGAKWGMNLDEVKDALGDDWYLEFDVQRGNYNEYVCKYDIPLNKDNLTKVIFGFKKKKLISVSEYYDFLDDPYSILTEYLRDDRKFGIRTRFRPVLWRIVGLTAPLEFASV